MGIGHARGNYIHSASSGSYPGLMMTSAVTYSHHTLVHSFLVQNNLIGPTRLETIAKVLNWSRRLSHFIGPFEPQNMEYHWQYRGLPPVSRIISGTTLTNPDLAHLFTDPQHWTMGCWGTSGFIKQLLRTVNIPVVEKSVPNPACPHSTPYFITEGLYLSHGDDPYICYFREGYTSVVPPMTELLIDQATYTAWFEGDPNEACHNISRRPIELLVWWLADEVVSKYCIDVYNNADHASGHVYQVYSNHFTVQELEATNLWGRLSQRAAELGYWCGGM